MKKFTILFDADDTVEDLLECWLRALNATHGTAIEKDDVTDWNIASFFPSLTAQEIYAPLYNKQFWKDLLPITGAAESLLKLKNDGHSLYMVTASNYQTAEPKMTKLLELFPFLDWNHIILAKNKQMIKGDILIDDGPHNLVGGDYVKFLFGGRILSNRGLSCQNVKSTLSNCYVISPPEDSIESLFECAKKLARTYSYGGGCGIDLSKIAPRGAKVNNTAKETSGSVSFMDLYSMVTGLIGQNGRRGALMISLDCSHPDIEEFIGVKSDLDRITKANISVKIDDGFMEAVKNGTSYELHFSRPESQQEITKTVDVRKIFHLIAKMNWEFAEPGALFWDRIKKWNLLSNTPDFEYAGVNPCAEEPLPAGGSCLLGSINLSEFVMNLSENEVMFDFKDFSYAVRASVEALNEVLDEGLPLHPLQEQRDSVAKWRQIGLGVFGIADLLIKLKIKYGSPEAIALSDKIASTMINSAMCGSALLAASDGAYDGYSESAVLGTEFFVKNADADTARLVKRYGLRNSQLLTIAPTGTISTMLNVSGGIEPIFGLHYNRKTESLHGHDESYEVNGVDSEYTDSEIPDYIVVSSDIAYTDRIKMQAAWQNHIDASISSTVNVPNDFSVEDTENLYLEAWKHGLKGITIYRDGCARAGILTTDKQPEAVSEKTQSQLGRGDIIDCSNDLIGKKRKLTTGCGTIHCMAWFDPVTGDLMETFIPKGGTGGCRCNTDAVSRLISLSSRGGICIESVVDQLSSCTDCGSYTRRTATKHDTSKGSSCPTACAYAILDMHNEVLEDLGLDDKDGGGKKKIVATTKSAVVLQEPLCPECGGPLRFEGGCNICPSCGWSKCG